MVGERFIRIVLLNVWVNEWLDCQRNLGTFQLSIEEQMIEVRMHNVEGLCEVDCITFYKDCLSDVGSSSSSSSQAYGH